MFPVSHLAMTSGTKVNEFLDKHTDTSCQDKDSIRLSIEKYGNLGGQHSTEVAFALLTQQPRIRFSVFARIFLKKSFLMLPRFIDDTSLSVESLNMLIKPSSTS